MGEQLSLQTPSQTPSSALGFGVRVEKAPICRENAPNPKYPRNRAVGVPETPHLQGKRVNSKPPVSIRDQPLGLGVGLEGRRLWMLTCPMCSNGQRVSQVDRRTVRCPWCGGRSEVPPDRAVAPIGQRREKAEREGRR
jgi:hypothetical protein